MKVMVTGEAGFIGFHVSKRLLERGDEVLGIDNLNDYYDVSLKEARLAQIQEHDGFSFQKVDLADREGLATLFVERKPDRVINLAAQAGVRHSIQHPHAYVDSNLVGFINILEGCRHNNVEHLVYASSSSVYGSNENLPFSVAHSVDHPISLYAATKKANELMAHTYSHLYSLPTTGLRFFTVYGPWGRPDMATFLFTKAILEDRPIDVLALDVRARAVGDELHDSVDRNRDEGFEEEQHHGEQRDAAGHPDDRREHGSQQADRAEDGEIEKLQDSARQFECRHSQCWFAACATTRALRSRMPSA